MDSPDRNKSKSYISDHSPRSQSMPMSPTILENPQKIEDFDNQLESIKQKHDLAKERLQERRA